MLRRPWLIVLVLTLGRAVVGSLWIFTGYMIYSTSGRSLVAIPVLGGLYAIGWTVTECLFNTYFNKEKDDKR